MFQGTIPQDCRRIIAEQVKMWPVSHVYVGCSGNFTVERVVNTMRPEIELHGNDVTIYSGTLGRFFSGQETGLELRDEDSVIEWVRPYLGDPLSDTASLLLLSDNPIILKANRPYYVRQLNALERAFPDLHRRMKERLAGMRLRLKTFAVQDVCEWITPLPKSQGFISFPPFLGAEDYEVMFIMISKLLTWPQPLPFPSLKADRIETLLRTITEFSCWSVGLPSLVPELLPYSKGEIQATPLGKRIFMYGSHGKTRVCIRKPTVGRSPPQLGAYEEVGGPLDLTVLEEPVFRGIQSHYMNADIPPARALSQTIGVVAGGKLVGCFAVQGPFGKLIGKSVGVPHPIVYLMSDFAVFSCRYRKLAKLVLVAALSRESQLLVERIFKGRRRGMTTTAFTNAQVSMKYRGLFRLLKRAEAKDQSAGKNMLQYGAPLGKWTLAEGLELWVKKYAA